MGNKSEDRNKVSLKNYKNKSKLQTKEIKVLKKRLVELRDSRDNWKQKCKTLKTQHHLKKRSEPICLGERPKKHHYPIGILWLCVQFQLYGGVSFRACRHCLVQLYMLLSLNSRVPSHVSIRTWACKCGYYRLKKGEKEAISPSSPYALIVDESISIGSERLLLVLGVPLEKHTFQAAVSMADVEVLSLKIAKEWKAEAISSVLLEVAQKHKITYIVSDKGNNLVKSYGANKYIHVPDITHVMAKALERIYKKDTFYIEMNAICGGLRRRWYMSKFAPLMPPSQRKKARFHNIFTLAVWAKNIITIYETLEDIPKKELLWMATHVEFIEEMLVLQKVVSQLSELLKVAGFSAKTQQEALKILMQCQTERTKSFKFELQNYFNDLAQSQELNTDLPNILLSCSDVIESAFGKFKYKISPNSIGGMTEFALTIANFGTTFSRQEILNAMESVECQDLKDWKSENEVSSLAMKKREIFPKKQNVKT